MNPAVKQAFTEIHDSGRWDVGETRDGTGSTMRFTELLITDLPNLLRRWHVTSILDAGCGEFNWMRHCDLSGISYVGGDVVADKLAILRRSRSTKPLMVKRSTFSRSVSKRFALAL